VQGVLVVRTDEARMKSRGTRACGLANAVQPGAFGPPYEREPGQSIAP